MNTELNGKCTCKEVWFRHQNVSPSSLWILPIDFRNSVCIFCLLPFHLVIVGPDVKAHRFLGFNFRSYVMAKSRECVISGRTEAWSHCAGMKWLEWGAGATCIQSAPGQPTQMMSGNSSTTSATGRGARWGGGVKRQEVKATPSALLAGRGPRFWLEAFGEHVGKNQGWGRQEKGPWRKVCISGGKTRIRGQNAQLHFTTGKVFIPESLFPDLQREIIAIPAHLWK